MKFQLTLLFSYLSCWKFRLEILFIYITYACAINITCLRILSSLNVYKSGINDMDSYIPVDEVEAKD